MLIGLFVRRLALCQSDLLLAYRRCSRLLSPAARFCESYEQYRCPGNTYAGQLGPRSLRAWRQSRHARRERGDERRSPRPRAASTFVKLTLPRPGLSKVLDLWPEEQIMIASPISVLGQFHPMSVSAPGIRGEFLPVRPIGPIAGRLGPPRKCLCRPWRPKSLHRRDRWQQQNLRLAKSRFRPRHERV